MLQPGAVATDLRLLQLAYWFALICVYLQPGFGQRELAERLASVRFVKAPDMVG